MSILFNSTFYLQNNPDVLQAVAQGIFPSAEAHFNEFGWKEGRDPNATFDVDLYLINNPDVLAAGVNPLAHFIAFGASEGRSPNAEFVTAEDFDTDAYAEANPDLAEAGIETEAELYAHFATFGFSEDRPGVQTNDGVAIVDGIGGGLQGDTFTLTTGVDDLMGTAGNDTFQGIVSDDSDDRTLNTFDNIDGGAGMDTLDLLVGTSYTYEGDEYAYDAALSSNFTVSNVEVINLISAGESESSSPVVVAGGVDAEDFGAEAQQIWQIDGATDIENLGAGTTAGFRGDYEVDVTVTAADGAESISVALDGVESGSEFDLEGDDVTTVNFSGSMEATGTSDLNLRASSTDLPELETINFAMTTDTQINSFDTALGSVVTVDASESTGDIKFALEEDGGIPSEALDIETINTGSGADMVTLDTSVFGADEVAVDLGAGNDELTLELNPAASAAATAFTVTTGSGEDTIILDGGNAAVRDDEFDGDMITITDFSAGDDVLSIAGFDGFSSQNLVDDAITDAEAETLFEVVSAVVEAIGGNGTNITDFAKFVFEGNTYVYGDIDGGRSLNSGDLLVELTGVVDLNNDNVVQFVA